MPVPCSLFPVPCSLFPVPCSLFPVPCSLIVNVRQLHYLVAAVDNGPDVSAAADAHFTSQPGISEQILVLEEELGVQPILRGYGDAYFALPAPRFGRRTVDALLGEGARA